jgi:hypothetical protein
VVPVLLVVGVGCGRGSAPHASGSAVLGKAFYRKAVALCRRALKERRAEPTFPYPAFNPTQPDLSRLRALRDDGATIFTTWLHQMLALANRPEGELRGQG